jgi:glycosyl transferase family WbsX
MTDALARLIAFYLPQFHPIPENDEWWGKGFTEWTNSAKARPLFRGHHQPHLPADLGFYDLRLAETRAAQAALAREYGVEGFCYYHYWFAGKQILERPFNEVLASGEPDFPFCLCWANQTWTGIWHGAPDRVLIEQTYPGEADYRAHFDSLLPAFRDPRYIRVDGKPLFVLYQPHAIPDARNVMEFWRGLAARSGLKGLYLVGNDVGENSPADLGLDALLAYELPERRPSFSLRTPVQWALRQLDALRGRPTVYRYEDVFPSIPTPERPGGENFPCIIPNWDNTPRSGKHGLVLQGSTPELFRRHAAEALERVRNKPAEHRIVFVKSWNEWAEGNYLEPDVEFGRGYLEALRDVFRSPAARVDRERPEMQLTA